MQTACATVSAPFQQVSYFYNTERGRLSYGLLNGHCARPAACPLNADIRGSRQDAFYIGRG